MAVKALIAHLGVGTSPITRLSLPARVWLSETIFAHWKTVYTLLVLESSLQSENVSLVPWPLPDFISQPCSEIKSGSGLERGYKNVTYRPLAARGCFELQSKQT